MKTCSVCGGNLKKKSTGKGTVWACKRPTCRKYGKAQ